MNDITTHLANNPELLGIIIGALGLSGLQFKFNKRFKRLGSTGKYVLQLVLMLLVIGLPELLNWVQLNAVQFGSFYTVVIFVTTSFYQFVLKEKRGLDSAPATPTSDDAEVSKVQPIAEAPASEYNL